MTVQRSSHSGRKKAIPMLQEKRLLLHTKSVLKYLGLCRITHLLDSYRVRVRPHRERAAAAGSDLCPRREGVRTVLCKTASSPSNRRRADAADQSRSRRAADICVLETDIPGGQYGMAEEFTEKLIEKSAGVRVLVRYSYIRRSVPSSH